MQEKHKCHIAKAVPIKSNFTCQRSFEHLTQKLYLFDRDCNSVYSNIHFPNVNTLFMSNLDEVKSKFFVF